MKKDDEVAKNRLWYAVQESREDPWDYGSYDFDEAKSMLKETGYTGLIAAIDDSITNPVCVAEYLYSDLF